MNRYKNNVDVQALVLFVLLAFGLPFICVLLVENISVFRFGSLNLILYGLEAATPALSALIVVRVLNGRAGAISFLKKCYADNISIASILLAIAIPFLMLTAAKLTSVMMGYGASEIGAAFTSKRFLIILWALIAEELGWRGFLQEKIDQYYGFPAAPVLVGVLWALWHYHFFRLETITAPVIWFAFGCITESFGYYWITKRAKGNIIPASIWHFTGNLLFNLFLLSPEYHANSNIPYIIFVAYTAVMAAIVCFERVYYRRSSM